MLLNVRKLAQKFPYAWIDILKEFEKSSPRVKVTNVTWEFPQNG